jgi:hypothetical protein
MEPMAFTGSGAKSKSFSRAPQGDLVYVSLNGGLNDTFVRFYSYNGLSLLGTLNGTFYFVFSLCVDKAQRVFVPDYDRAQIDEYEHGRLNPFRALADAVGFPVGCAVDPSNGDLAVTNFYDPGGPGQVVIYRRARGLPKSYIAPDIYYYWFASYDDSGDLFVDGAASGTCSPSICHVVVAMMPKGAKTFTDLTLDKSIGYPGGLVWDGNDLVVGDQDTNEVYRFKISGFRGKLEGVTDLGGAQDVYQFFIRGNRIFGADHTAGAVYFWSYPAGGSPVTEIARVKNASGVVVSAQTP